MKMTEERVQNLTNYLSVDPDRMMKLFELTAEDAVAQINSDGYDFTADELKEFAEAVITVSQQDELDVDALDNVSGGFAITLTVGTVSCVCSIVRLCGPYVAKFGYWAGTKIGNAIFK